MELARLGLNQLVDFVSPLVIFAKSLLIVLLHADQSLRFAYRVGSVGGLWVFDSRVGLDCGMTGDDVLFRFDAASGLSLPHSLFHGFPLSLLLLKPFSSPVPEGYQSFNPFPFYLLPVEGL